MGHAMLVAVAVVLGFATGAIFRMPFWVGLAGCVVLQWFVEPRVMRWLGVRSEADLELERIWDEAKAEDEARRWRKAHMTPIA